VNDRPFIVLGLIVFVAFVTTPIWRGMTTRNVALAALEIKLPAQEKTCVAPVNYMRAWHMRLLEQWRSDVVRGRQRQYVAYNSKVYDKNLTRTCVGCHGNHQDFCDRCHNYNGVAALNCWECHNDAPPAGRNAP